MLISCNNNEMPAKYFSFVLDQPTMIVNKEGINNIEGTYLNVDSGGGTKTIKLNFLPLNINYVTKNLDKWMLGWGTSKPLYDAGVENLREIINIDTINNIITLGKLLLGEGFPNNKKNIVFWNREPSGFKKYQQSPIIDYNSGWKGFAGKSITFSSIIKDSANNRWIMYLNEVDTNAIQIYAAESKNLYNWQPLNQGNPIITANDFKNISWAGNSKDQKTLQTAIISDVVFFKGKWHFIMDGYDKNGKRHIGEATTTDPANGPFLINKSPIVSAGEKGDWDESGCFFAKVVFDGEKFLMYYDGVKSDHTERLGLAISYDLKIWKKYKNNPLIDDKTGWRSKLYTNEPAYVDKINDKIYLIFSGAKEFKMGAFHHYISRRMYLDKPGNVDDNQLGLFVSEDGGYTFCEHINNPVFVNNYADIYENEHMGGCFELIKDSNKCFLFYQAKTTFDGLTYKPFLRIKEIIE